MKLRYITCSGANEKTPYKDLIELSNLSKLVEIGIAANSNIMKKTTPQYDWFEELLNTEEASNMNLSMHINNDWCVDLCNGKMMPEIEKLLNICNKKRKPAIRRWQLNISNHMNLQDVSHIQSLIKSYPEQEFIFSFNNGPIVMSFLKKLSKTNTHFSLLYDSSYGSGRNPQNWEGPYFPGRDHGYSGGLCGENVYKNLEKISYVVPTLYSTWIDAEYKLKTPNSTNFDLLLAKNYVEKALEWQNKNISR